MEKFETVRCVILPRKVYEMYFPDSLVPYEDYLFMMKTSTLVYADEFKAIGEYDGEL